MTASQTAPGQKVVFTVTGDDPDAAPLQECNIDFGDSTGFHCDPRPAIDPSYCPKQYGPWTPPAKQGGSYTGDWDHVYSEPGNYTFTIQLNLNGVCGHDPYRSQGGGTITVTVNP